MLRRFAEPRTGRSETAEHPAAIDEAKLMAGEAHDMVPIFEFGEADEFARERRAS